MKYESDNNVNVLESENNGILSNFDQIAHLRVTMSIGHCHVYMLTIPVNQPRNQGGARVQVHPLSSERGVQ